MKKALLTSIAVLLLATGAEYATEDFCAVVLKPPANVVQDKEYNPEGWLTIRDGPGKQFIRMGKLRAGDFLWADTARCKELDGQPVCDNKQEWTHIVGIPRFDGPPDYHHRSYSDGWVSNKYIQTFACEQEQANEADRFDFPVKPGDLPTYDNPNPHHP